MAVESSVSTSGATGAGSADRDLHLDGLRGFAVLLVVLGHAAINPYFHDAYAAGRVLLGGQWFDASAYTNLIYNLTYSFHMPLFAFVSGLLGSRSSLSGARMLRRRFESLMIPYFAWATFAYILARAPLAGVPQQVWALATNPTVLGAAWFLYALFASYLILALTELVPWRRSALLGAAALCIGFSFTRWGGVDLLGARWVVWIFPFFVLGYLIGPVSEKVFAHRALFGWTAAAVYGLIMVVAFPIVHIETNPGYAWLATWMHDHHIPGAFVLQRTAIYLCAAAGVMMCYVAFGLVKGHLLRWFVWLGRRALGIYLIQGFVLAPLIAAGVGPVAVLFAVTLGGSALGTLLLEQTGLTRRLFLGLRSKPLPVPQAVA